MWKIKPNVETVGTHTMTIGNNNYTYTVTPGSPSADYSTSTLSVSTCEAGTIYKFTYTMRDRLGFSVTNLDSH